MRLIPRSTTSSAPSTSMLTQIGSDKLARLKQPIEANPGDLDCCPADYISGRVTVGAGQGYDAPLSKPSGWST
jgi:hypothetical protein